MRAALITASYLDGNDGMGNPRLERNLRYLSWYEKIQEDLGFDKIYFFDNASDPASVARVEGACPLLKVIRFNEHLTGGKFSQDYLYLWRVLYSLPMLFGMYDKLICIDSDFFVLSRRLAEWIRERESGWSTVWCRRHAFPEAGMHVLCRDAYGRLEKLMETPMEKLNGSLMEKVIPFTHMTMEFNCDRFGEYDAPWSPDMDLYGQAKLTTPLKYGG